MSQEKGRLLSLHICCSNVHDLNDDDNDLLPSEIIQNVVVDDDVVLYGLKRHKIIWYFSMA